MQGQSQTSQIAIGAMDEANSARSSISCTMPSYTGQDSDSKFNISTTQQHAHHRLYVGVYEILYICEGLTLKLTFQSCIDTDHFLKPPIF